MPTARRAPVELPTTDPFYPHAIHVFDQHIEGLSPEGWSLGRWTAVFSRDTSLAHGHGATKEEAVEHLKRELAKKHPDWGWYQQLTVIEPFP